MSCEITNSRTAAPQPAVALQQENTDLYGYTADDVVTNRRWFRVCCANCLERHRRPCGKVGEYYGIYVVVQPGIGQEMLTRLTMVMLDFAQFDPAKPPAKKDLFQGCMDKYLQSRIDRLSCDILATENQLAALKQEDPKRKELLQTYSTQVADLKTFVDTRASLANGAAQQSKAAQPASAQRTRDASTLPYGLLPLLQQQNAIMGTLP
ncbi:MAG: hypothetical protein ACLP9L_37565 [Thermoguttaceae bacterium]